VKETRIQQFIVNLPWSERKWNGSEIFDKMLFEFEKKLFEIVKI